MSRPPPLTIPLLDSSPNRTPTDNGDVSRPAPPALGAQPDPDLIETQILLDALDGAVRGIFSVGLTLAATRSLAAGPVTARVDQALDELDDLVRQLRRTALIAHRPDR